jgi:hypothetical protein
MSINLGRSRKILRLIGICCILLVQLLVWKFISPLSQGRQMKKMNNKQVEAISSAFANLGNILFLGIAVATVAVIGSAKASIGTWLFSFGGWLICQISSVLTLSYWREENGSN